MTRYLGQVGRISTNMYVFAVLRETFNARLYPWSQNDELEASKCKLLHDEAARENSVPSLNSFMQK